MPSNTPSGVHYRRRYGPVTFECADGSTVEAHKRADGQWGWTKRSRNGRKIATNGQGIQRVRAIEAARRESGQ